MQKTKRIAITFLTFVNAFLLSGQSSEKTPTPYTLRRISSLIENEPNTQSSDCSIPRNLLPEMISVDGGNLTIGCTAEQGADCKDTNPPRAVSVSAFKLSKTEITNAQYCAFLNACKVDGYGWHNNHRMLDVFGTGIKIRYVNKKWLPQKGFERFPMICVTWFGADAYCRAAGGRLPTETEWEFAARGGNLSGKYKYAGSANLKKVGWHANNSNNCAHAVATLQANELGLFDMSGNVWEWCSDIFAAQQDTDLDDDDRDDDPPQLTDEDVVHVLRGGCWYDQENYCTVSFRDGNRAGDTDSGNGFRLAMDGR
jgi:formylglycine-generating enzyme required for sulfatase activity